MAVFHKEVDRVGFGLKGTLANTRVCSVAFLMTHHRDSSLD